MRYLFISNSKSQTSTIKELEDAISELDDDLRVRIEVRYTEYPGHARDIAVEASDANGAGITIVSCGGDGTFHEIANALAFRSTPIICIPMGTGNDFARIIFPQESMKEAFSTQNLQNFARRPPNCFFFLGLPFPVIRRFIPSPLQRYAP